MAHYIITAFGEDRPGIVAKVTKILYENGFNIEDSSMTRLNNEFTIMLIVKGENGESLKTNFENLEKNENLTISIKEIPEDIFYKEDKRYKTILNIVVYGADRPGIVYNVSQTLADLDINISDLRTEKTPDLYIMFIEAELPKDTQLEELQNRIDNLKESLKVDISVNPVEEAEL
ncbi:MAG: ACT domain-containing protein [Hydrogenothermaceae bacterium]